MASASSGHSAICAEVARAEELDRSGEHAAALDQLVAGVRKGDVEATTRLGKRLLIGAGAPLLPNDGARLIEDASAQGGAEAAAVLAVLFAIGASRNHTLAAALDTLVVAAERGWAPAQAQLRVLAADAIGEREPAQSESWRDVAARVDLAAWTAVPPATDLSSSPLIRSYPRFLSAGVCEWLIGKAHGRLGRALVYEALSKEVMAHPTRTNTAASFNMLETDVVCVLTQLRMAAALQVSFRQFEPITVLHYDPGEEITEHFDFVDPEVPDYTQQIAERGQRIVTFLVYLNDDYAGGETQFPRLGVSRKGVRGEGLFFVNALEDGSADTRTLHAGRTPVDGEKWIVSQFVRNRRVF